MRLNTHSSGSWTGWAEGSDADLDISPVLELLRAEYGLEADGAYYRHIEEWTSWWRGLYEPFHRYRERCDEHLVEREMYTMRLAKKVCEDWAAILLSERTRMGFDDPQAGALVEETFDRCDFWRRANELCERAFATGTGAAVLRVEGARLDEDGVPHGGRIRMEFLSADAIVPLSVEGGRITEAAFVSESIVRGQRRVYVETHTRQDGCWHIRNRFFRMRGGRLEEIEPPEGVAGQVRLPFETPLFSILSPNIVGNIDGARGLGISVFANAIDNLKGIDLAFNNFCRDFKLGGKKVFINQRLTRRDAQGRVLTPDDVAQQLFTTMGEAELDDTGRLIQEFNPSLRVEENRLGLQAQLDYLSFKVGFGTRYYRFEGNGTSVTATQYVGDKREFLQHAAKHAISAERFLRGVIGAVLALGRGVLGLPLEEQQRYSIRLDDGYILDAESERKRDMEQVGCGVMSAEEYRAKWL